MTKNSRIAAKVTNNTTKQDDILTGKVIVLSVFCLFIALMSVRLINSVNSYGICDDPGAALPSDPSLWDTVLNPIPNAFLFNATPAAALIDTACYAVGLPWEPNNITYKPFPNTCDGSYYGICAEDSENYSTSRTYFTSNTTYRFCVNNDTINWRWMNAINGHREFQTNFSQICSGGALSVDTSCSSIKYFNRTRTGAVNYMSWNATGIPYTVYRDPAAFSPTCYGRINGTITDLTGAPLQGVDVDVLISGPGTEKYFTSNTTVADGTYNIYTIPATNYSVLFSKTNFNGVSVSAKVNYTNTTTIDWIMTSGDCNDDCTTQSERTKCAARCDGMGSCNFASPMVASLLDGALKGSDVPITLGASQFLVNACEGSPVAYEPLTIKSAQVTCAQGETIIILEDFSTRDGQPIKVVVPVCRKSPNAG